MPGAAVDGDRLVLADVLLDRPVLVERGLELVEVGDLQVGPAADRALLACVAERAVEEDGWAEINAANLTRLAAGIGAAPRVELPFLFTEEFGRAELDLLSARLEADTTVRDAAAVGRRRP